MIAEPDHSGTRDDDAPARAAISAPAPAAPTPERSFEFERLIFFSDAVFAIAITLLVLDIRIPDIPEGRAAAELPGLVNGLIPSIVAYFISFVVIAVYWVAHHRTFSYIRRYDGRLIWLNVLLLLFIAFLPFPSALLGRYGDTFFAFVFYAVFQIIISLILAAIWAYATHKHRLVDPNLAAHTIHLRFVGTLAPPLIFALSIAVARYSTTLGQFFWLLLIVTRRFSDRLVRRVGE